MTFEFVFIYRHLNRKWVFLVDSKCRNTVILIGLTYTSSWKVFHDGCAKRGIFSHQILNKNSLSLAHCALNRSFMVNMSSLPIIDKFLRSVVVLGVSPAKIHAEDETKIRQKVLKSHEN